MNSYINQNTENNDNKALIKNLCSYPFCRSSLSLSPPKNSIGGDLNLGDGDGDGEPNNDEYRILEEGRSSLLVTNAPEC